MTSHSKTRIKICFPVTEATIKIKLGSSLEKLTQQHNRRERTQSFDMSQDDCENDICASSQFLQIQKNHLIDPKDSLERYCNGLTVFRFNSAKLDLSLYKTYLFIYQIKFRFFTHTKTHFSIPKNKVNDPNFPCNSDPHHLVAVFLQSWKIWRHKAKHKRNFCSLISKQEQS